MTEFPADQPAEHPTGFPVESEPQNRPDPETEPGVGGEPDFDSEPDRGATDFLAPSNDPDPDDAPNGVAASAAASADESPWSATPETPWDDDADLPWESTASSDAGMVDETSSGESGDSAGVAVGGELESDGVVAGATHTSDIAGESEELAPELGEMAVGVADDITDEQNGMTDPADTPGPSDELHDVTDASDEATDGGPDDAGGEDDGERGHPVVGETVERLEELRDRPVSEHAEVYADLHERLQSALAEADRTDGEHTSERV